MIGIDIYPDFSLGANWAPLDRDFLECFQAVRKITGAQYVNFAVFDYRGTYCRDRHFLTFPMDWLLNYVKNSFQNIDPLLTIDYRRVSFVDWQDLWRTKNEITYFNALIEHGIGCNALTMVSPMGHQKYGALSLVFDQEFDNWSAFCSQNMDLIRFQSERVCKRYANLHFSYAKNNFKLTKREVECLNWVALGKTDEQIAMLMGIGRWTVISHNKSVKTKLDCSNRSAAVAKAITCGILDLGQ